jgi:EXPERA (EXPanded EBP superfamily)
MSEPFVFSSTPIYSLGAVAAIILAAYGFSTTLLPKGSSRKIHLIFIWHMFDGMLHSTLEASFLYHCFFSWAPISDYKESLTSNQHSRVMNPPGVSFLAQPSRLYGPAYGSGPMAAFWQEYAHADRRAGGADLTTICMELLCVFVIGPLAFYVCHLLRKGQYGKAWFWMTFIASSELYGSELLLLDANMLWPATDCFSDFMTFAPEWITGSPNLNTSDPVYFWLYLLFFNAGLWVLIPAWILWELYHAMGFAFANVDGRKVETTRSMKRS